MESVKNIETNTRANIILGLLEDLKLNERPDLTEFLEELTSIFYACRDKYIGAGADEMEAREKAMDDVSTYAVSENEE